MKKELKFSFTADTSDFDNKMDRTEDKTNKFFDETQAKLNGFGMLVIEVDTAEGIRQVQAFANDTKKALDPSKVIELEDKWAKLTVAKKQARDELKEIEKLYKAGVIDINQVEEAQLKFDLLSKATTEAGRQVSNYKNTGNESLSRLQTKFNQVTDEIKASRDELEKVGKSTKNLDVLINKADELQKQYAEGNITQKEFIKGMQDVQKQSVNTGSTFDTLKRSVGGFIAGVVSLRSIYQSYQLALEEQSGNERLYRLLQNTTGATREQVQVLESQAKALEKVGVVTAGTTGVVQSQLATFDLSISTIKTLTPAILNYVTAEKGAKATSDDFKTATNGLAQALNGNFASLTKVGFVLDDQTKKLISNGTETERANAIVQVLNSTYADFNKNLRESNEGQLAIFQNNMEALQTSIGNSLIPIFNTLIETFNPLIGGLEAITQEFPKTTTAIAGVTTGVVALGVAFTVLGGPITILVGVVAGLTLGFGALYKITKDVQTEFSNLTQQTIDNQTKQEKLTDAYNRGVITLEEFKKKISELKDEEEQLNKKTKELQGTFSYFLTKTKAIILSTVRIVAGGIATLLVGTGELVGNLLGFVFENVKRIPKNFGIAFDNIPYYIQGGLNIALQKLTDFINKYKDLLNKIPGIDIGNIQFDKITGAKKTDFDFVGISADNFKMTQKSIDLLINEFENFGKVGAEVTGDLGEAMDDLGDGIDGTAKKPVKSLNSLNEKLKGLKETLGEMEVGSEEFKTLQKEIQATEDEIKKYTETSGKSSAEIKKQLKDLEKEKKEIEEKEKKALEEKKKGLESLAKENSNTYGSILKDFEKGLDGLEKYIQEIEKTKKTIQDLRDSATENIRDINNELAELESGSGEKLGNRFIEIGDSIQKAKEELKDLQDKGVDLQLAESIGAENLSLIPKDSTIGNNTVADLLKILEIQAEIKRLTEEQALAQKNLTDTQIADAQIDAKKSETEKLLEEQEAQKKVLEERKKIYEAIANGEKINLDEIQDYKNLKLAEDLQAKQDNLNLELKTLENNVESQRVLLANLNESRKTFETEWTAFFGTEVGKQIEFQKQLQASLIRTIELQKQAGMSGVNFGNQLDESQSQTAKKIGTEIGQKVVNIEQNNYNLVDFDVAMRQVNNAVE